MGADMLSRRFRTEESLYDVGITVRGRIISSSFDELSSALTEATAGRIEIKKLGEEFGY